MMAAALFPALSMLSLSGCSQRTASQPASPASSAEAPKAAEAPALKQAEICVAQDIRVGPVCEEGQRVVFMPQRWGNEQLPVLFASLNCDLRYSVVMTNGGVTCIHLKAETPSSTPATAASGASGAASDTGR